jgi:hypothetical protein
MISGLFVLVSQRLVAADEMVKSNSHATLFQIVLIVKLCEPEGVTVSEFSSGEQGWPISYGDPIIPG